MTTPLTNSEERLTSRLTRYVSFPRYVDLLLNGLFAPQVTLFEDPWEGHIFHGMQVLDEKLASVTPLIDRFKHWIYASCWHANKDESYAMWRIYGQHSEAVAVHTDFARLRDLMVDYSPGVGDPVALLTAVTYADPALDTYPDLGPETIYASSWENPANADRARWRQLMRACLASKPLAYSYEREVRLLLLDRSAPDFGSILSTAPPSTRGLRLSVPDFNQFLIGVTVAPYSPPWFLEVVRETSSRFGLDLSVVNVEPSKMYDGPTRRDA